MRYLVLLCLFALTITTRTHAFQEYSVADVQYESEGVAIAGALWLPDKKGPHPVIVMAHGSGRSRKENGNGMARHFVAMGFAVLTHDKRGVANSGGTYVGRNNASESNLTLLAKDISAGIDFLKTRSDIDDSQIGLWGVSQAGWIIPIVTSLQKDIKFTILISGPTVTVGEENTYSRITGDGSISSKLSSEEISKKLLERGPYGFDPLPFLKQMNIPGLWLLGEKDESIPIPETVSILDELINNDGKDFMYKVFPAANHGLRVNRQLVPDYWDVQDKFLLDYVKIQLN